MEILIPWLMLFLLESVEITRQVNATWQYKVLTDKSNKFFLLFFHLSYGFFITERPEKEK